MKSLLLIFSLSFLSSVAVAAPIHDAAETGNLQEVQRLINAGASVNRETAWFRRTPLQIASFNGQLEMVRLLLANKAYVNARNTDDRTALHHASIKGYFEIAKLLLANKADVNVKTKQTRRTPLHFASDEGHLEVAKLLIENEADVNSRTLFNWTPLDFAKAKENNAVVQYLISKGAK